VPRSDCPAAYLVVKDQFCHGLLCRGEGLCCAWIVGDYECAVACVEVLIVAVEVCVMAAAEWCEGFDVREATVAVFNYVMRVAVNRRYVASGIHTRWVQNAER
jgi:hypothetical protein